MLITTTEKIPGQNYKVIGEVFGVTTQSRNAFANIGANLKNLVGGEIRAYTKMLTNSRDRPGYAVRGGLRNGRQVCGLILAAKTYPPVEKPGNKIPSEVFPKWKSKIIKFWDERGPASLWLKRLSLSLC